MDLLNKNFQQWGIFEKYLSIDEMIVRCYGHHSLKQFIRAKPIKFGYKLWAVKAGTASTFLCIVEKTLMIMRTLDF